MSDVAIVAVVVGFSLAFVVCAQLAYRYVDQGDARVKAENERDKALLAASTNGTRADDAEASLKLLRSQAQQYLDDDMRAKLSGVQSAHTTDDLLALSKSILNGGVPPRQAGPAPGAGPGDSGAVPPAGPAAAPVGR